MKVAVTGGTGFIGQSLVAELVARGHGVTVLQRASGPAAQARLPQGVATAFFDAAGPQRGGLLDGFEGVIHLAGESISERWTPENKERVLRSRVQGTTAIADAAKESGTVKTLISGSAIGFYGPHGPEELDESAPAGDDFLATVCKAWEAAATSVTERNIRLVHPRIGVVLHPEGGALKKMVLPFKMGAGGRLGSGTQYISWIHREDLIRLLVHALETTSLRGPVNATAPQPVTNKEFTQALGKALHRPALFPTPAFALKLALGEMSAMVLEGQRVLPKVALASGFKFRFEQLAPALEDLFREKAASAA